MRGPSQVIAHQIHGQPDGNRHRCTDPIRGRGPAVTAAVRPPAAAATAAQNGTGSILRPPRPHLPRKDWGRAGRSGLDMLEEEPGEYPGVRSRLPVVGALQPLDPAVDDQRLVDRESRGDPPSWDGEVVAARVLDGQVAGSTPHFRWWYCGVSPSPARSNGRATPRTAQERPATATTASNRLYGDAAFDTKDQRLITRGIRFQPDWSA